MAIGSVLDRLPADVLSEIEGFACGKRPRGIDGAALRPERPQGLNEVLSLQSKPSVLKRIAEWNTDVVFAISKRFESVLGELQETTGDATLIRKFRDFKFEFLKRHAVEFSENPLQTPYESARLLNQKLSYEIQRFALSVIRAHPSVKIRTVSDRRFRKDVTILKQYEDGRWPAKRCVMIGNFELALQHAAMHPEDKAAVFERYHVELLEKRLFGTYFDMLLSPGVPADDFEVYAENLINALYELEHFDAAIRAVSLLYRPSNSESMKRMLESASIDIFNCKTAGLSRKERLDHLARYEACPVYFECGFARLIERHSGSATFVATAHSIVRGYRFTNEERMVAALEKAYPILWKGQAVEECEFVIHFLPPSVDKDTYLSSLIQIMIKRSDGGVWSVQKIPDFFRMISDVNQRDFQLLRLLELNQSENRHLLRLCAPLVSEVRKPLWNAALQLQCMPLERRNPKRYRAIEENCLRAIESCDQEKLQIYLIAALVKRVAAHPDWNDFSIMLTNRCEPVKFRAKTFALKCAFCAGNRLLFEALKESVPAELFLQTVYDLYHENISRRRFDLSFDAAMQVADTFERKEMLTRLQFQVRSYEQLDDRERLNLLVRIGSEIRSLPDEELGLHEEDRPDSVLTGRTLDGRGSPEEFM